MTAFEGRHRIVAASEIGLIAVAAVTILFMTGLTGVDVLGRYFFGAPIAGAFELTEFAMAISVFSALPIVSLRRKHVTADLFTDRLSPGLRGLHERFVDAAGLTLFAILTWRLWLEAGDAAAYGTTAGILALPMAPLSYYAAALSGLNVLIFAAHILGLTKPAPQDDLS